MKSKEVKALEKELNSLERSDTVFDLGEITLAGRAYYDLSERAMRGALRHHSIGNWGQVPMDLSIVNDQGVRNRSPRVSFFVNIPDKPFVVVTYEHASSIKTWIW